ncbi:MAG: response regulator, partial [Nitrospirae bacterium]|nr:response regulator [Nitrospirota bacterium]
MKNKKTDKNQRVLLVEDTRIEAENVKMTIEDLGYTVVGIASSGSDAIRMAGEKNPDIILMDIMLKGSMDGIDASLQISARYDIPIIYLTAYADDRTLERAKITEPYGYIVKPFDERELHTAIEIALYKHGMKKSLNSALFNSIGDAIITTNTLGMVSYMNSAAERLTGWKLGDAVNKDLDSLIQIVEQKDR